MPALLRVLWRSAVSIVLLAIMWITLIVIWNIWPARTGTQTAWLLGALLVEAMCVRKLFSEWRHRDRPELVLPYSPAATVPPVAPAVPELPPAEYREFDEQAFQRWLAEHHFSDSDLPPEKLYGLRQAFLGG